jgi:hypothetical protein
MELDIDRFGRKIFKILSILLLNNNVLVLVSDAHSINWH